MDKQKRLTQIFTTKECPKESALLFSDICDAVIAVDPNLSEKDKLKVKAQLLQEAIYDLGVKHFGHKHAVDRTLKHNKRILGIHQSHVEPSEP